jgi:hypothetical protein
MHWNVILKELDESSRFWFGLVCNLLGKMGINHLIQDVMW